jgi:predicted RNase H-like nuclease
MTPDQRISRLLETWAQILVALGQEILVAGFTLPDRSTLRFTAELKPYEDKLDALISAWVGACALEGTAQPYGNGDCAIWVPMALKPA